MIIGLSAVLLLVAAVVLATRFSSRTEATVACYGSDASFLDHLSLRRYQPMLRLASQLDKEFLKEAHGKTLGTCYRRIQRDLLREYLRDLTADFNRLYHIATDRAVQASSDPGDLSLSLLEQQMSFMLSVWGIEARLLVDDYLPFAVDLQPLVVHLEGLANQTRAVLRPRTSYSFGAL